LAEEVKDDAGGWVGVIEVAKAREDEQEIQAEK
jgi:hypothetical protein